MTQQDSTPPSPTAVALAGLVALAVAMGIGRFAFTPLMPLMMRDGLISADVAAELAAANYVGYLVGALSAARLGRSPLSLMRRALMGVVALTLASAWVSTGVAAWAVRGAAGVCSAWVLVGASSWCLRDLSLRGAARHGGWIYTGVGLGITAAGVMAWIGGAQPSAWLWVELAIAALAGTAVVAMLLRAARDPRPVVTTADPAPVARWAAGRPALIASYGSFGFGYIVAATFLPAMARQQVDDPRVFGLAWPIFGLAAALSVACAVRWLAAWPRQRLWAAAQSAMAVGAALPLAGHGPWLLGLSAVLVGGTFMVATMAGLQWARDLEPDAPTRLLSQMTAAFATGQIAGPLVVRLAGALDAPGIDPIDTASLLAALALALSAAWLWRAPAADRHRRAAPPD